MTAWSHSPRRVDPRLPGHPEVDSWLLGHLLPRESIPDYLAISSKESRSTIDRPTSPRRVDPRLSGQLLSRESIPDCLATFSQESRSQTTWTHSHRRVDPRLSIPGHLLSRELIPDYLAICSPESWSLTALLPSSPRRAEPCLPGHLLPTEWKLKLDYLPGHILSRESNPVVKGEDGGGTHCPPHKQSLAFVLNSKELAIFCIKSNNKHFDFFFRKTISR
jgi:hypothetical protein